MSASYVFTTGSEEGWVSFPLTLHAHAERKEREREDKWLFELKKEI